MYFAFKMYLHLFSFHITNGSFFSYKNGPSSASFYFVFCLFKQTIQLFLQQIIHLVSGAGFWAHDPLNMSLFA